MILSDIKRYLMERGQATLADIAIHFDSDQDAVRGMMEVWIRKGKVQKAQANRACGDSCTQCDGSTEIYVWGTTGSRFRGIPIATQGCDR